VDHGVAGAWLVKNWAYPEDFAEVCQHHHDPLDDKDPALLRLIKIACLMADSLDFSAVHYQNVITYTDILLQMPSPLRVEMFPAEDELRANVKARLAVFEIHA
jgi:HD-like signal output (HDOD) protein